jgi:hypothetical protein
MHSGEARVFSFSSRRFLYVREEEQEKTREECAGLNEEKARERPSLPSLSRERALPACRRFLAQNSLEQIGELLTVLPTV